MARFKSHLEDASTVLELAQRLGAVCLDRGSRLQEAMEDDLERKLIDALDTSVRGTRLASWERALSKPDQFEAALGQRVSRLLRKANPDYPVDCLGVLRGLCSSLLAEFYLGTNDEIVLERGSPVPFAIRPLNEIKDFEATTYQGTQGNNGLLRGCGARIFEYGREEQLRVTLDYGEREALDELTWTRHRRLPRIASIHPANCGKIKAKLERPGRFFDAEPVVWDPDHILDLLRRVADVEIAVLPELSLREADPLEASIQADPESYPELIVAGSAHLREKSGKSEIRANESRVYLSGRKIGIARKHHPYEARQLDGKKIQPPAFEALSGEQKTTLILSGEHTRLAVCICADLIDEYAPQKLRSAGVNLLIAPSFTPKLGSFSDTATGLANVCQGVTVIANAPPEDATRPFHGIAGVPRPEPAQKLAVYPISGSTPTEIAVIDPNQPMDGNGAIVWR